MTYFIFFITLFLKGVNVLQNKKKTGKAINNIGLSIVNDAIIINDEERPGSPHHINNIEIFRVSPFLYFEYRTNVFYGIL